MKKKVLVTGASGFIGRALTAYLAADKKYDVLGVDIKKGDPSTGRSFALDLLDQKRAETFLRQQRPAVIFHLAGGRMVDTALLFSSNIGTTAALFGSIGRIKGYRPRVIVMGSAAEYGVFSGRKRITEMTVGRIETAYAACKAAQTQLAIFFAKAGHDVLVGRLFNIIGPGIPLTLAGGRFARSIVQAEQRDPDIVIETGSLKAVRDLLDIRDICSALCAMAERGRSGEIYNICSEKGVVMRDLLMKMVALSRKPGISWSEGATHEAGVLFAVGSCAKFRKDTGWRPRIGLTQSLKDTLGYYRQSASVGP